MSAIIMGTKEQAINARDVQALTVILRNELHNTLCNIPNELKALKAWVVWRIPSFKHNGKFDKVPCYPASGRNRSGQEGSSEDRAALGTWDEARAALNRDGTFAGVGIAMLPDQGLVALDVDHCVQYGKPRQDVWAHIGSTYAEISPSGTGIRAFWFGTATNGRNPDTGYELYTSKQFLTVTGAVLQTMQHILDLPIPTLSDELRAALEHCSKSPIAKNGPVIPKLAEVSQSDPVYQRLVELGMVERDMGNGRYSIMCPFEDEHSGAGVPGTADTVYFLPHTGGHTQGYFDCKHAHCADRSRDEYMKAIGIDVTLDALTALLGNGEWPDPQPIPDDLLAVPSFDTAMLPDAFRPWIEDIAERMQIGADIPAIGAITALSSAIGPRQVIQPKQEDNWTVVPNLWGCVVAPPGFMKSPALNDVIKPLNSLEQERYREYENAMKEWTSVVDSIRIKNTAAKERAKAALKKNPNAEVPAMIPEPPQPVCTRYTVGNFSLEALGEVLRGNPDGVLAFADELHGLFKMMDRQGNESIRDFLLQAWDGDKPHTFDRIGRGLGLRIDTVCVSILGGIQPGRLMEHVIEAVRGGRGDSGFMQRFQLMVWPDLKKEWKLIDKKPDAEAQQAASRVFQRIVGNAVVDFFTANLGDAPPSRKRRFNAEAQNCFNAWLAELEPVLRAGETPSVLISHLSKYRSLIPSLALVFAVADDVQGDIPLRYVQMAIAWSEYLRAHAERIYFCSTQVKTQSARALLAKIREGKVLDGFKAQDVYMKNWSQLDRQGLAEATNLLAELGYLIRVEHKPGLLGGRPSVTYRVHPKVLS